MLASLPDFRQNNVTLGASLSLVRGLYLVSMTHYDVLSLFSKLLSLILNVKKIEFSSLLFSFEHCSFSLFFYLSLIISHFQAFEFDFKCKKIEFSSLLFSFEHCSFSLYFYLSLIISYYA